MDTKWNSTETAVLPGEAQPEDPRRVLAKTVLAFLAFFLGLSLVLAALGTALGRWAAQGDSGDLLETDWQETQAFRNEVSAYLKEFLTLGAGGELDWYNSEAVEGGTVVLSDRGWSTAVSDNAFSDAAYVDPTDDDPDYWYEQDENVLYRVCMGNVRWYKNIQAGKLMSYNTLPEGYNFLLIYQDGQVSIWKDGQELDVYGDGVYDGGAEWFVPGYKNFPAGEGVEDVSVCMAVREVPLQYYTGDYQNGGVRENCRMYWIYRSLRENRQFWLTRAVLLAAGLALLAVWFLLRRYRPGADRRVASWTRHVWTEFRFLAAAAALAALLLPRLGSTACDLWYEIRYGGLFSAYTLTCLGRALAVSLENTGALLALVWTVWLIRNDHRYNPRTERRSLWRLLSVRVSKYPFQKRVTWQNRAAALLPAVLLAAGILIDVSMGVSPLHWLFYVLVVLPAASALLLWLVLYRHAALARDIGLLADQVESIRSGDLSTPLDLPADADLRQTAEALNDIQAGLERALEERTRSERMKVELVSNVSHDLKTPLTSILSYAELLRQEPLEGASADYARIIDEKAQRLKAMVQDVFEVSKAAADQLPVEPERLDFAKLLRQTLADLEDPIQKSGLVFRVDLPEAPVEIVADGKRLYRVFQNLIGNALQYALPGSRVYLTLRTGEGRAEASLRNTSRAELPAGVDFTARFVRGDASRTDGGSGLGLSIARSFTEACGGAFRIETLADLFTAIVTFPLAE